MGAALGERRILSGSEAVALPWIAAVTLGVACVALLWPALLAWPLAAFAAWIGIAAALRYVRVRRAQARAKREACAPVAETPQTRSTESQIPNP
jgi:cardiolipin synthase